jgi:hypothetical protein
MGRFFAFAARAALVGGLLAGLAVACSNQGEGERCDTLADNGGNDDCQDGLVCTPGTSLNPPQSTDRCCPQDRTQAQTSVCQQPTTSVGGDAAPPPFDSGLHDGPSGDSSNPDSATDSSASDAPVDSPIDSPVDAGVDAGVDAPVDSPTGGG